jgi:3-dehydroquinate dehydratase / shikimate dehydrogenase
MTGLSRPGRRCTVVASLTAAPWQYSHDLRLLNRAGGVLEIRADVIGDIDPAVLRNHFSGEVIYSLRSTGAGGRFAGSSDQRLRRLLAAAKRYDLVELEFGRDTVPRLLTAIPPHHRLISWHGQNPGADLAWLLSRYNEMSAIPARHYLIVPRAVTAEHALAPLQMLRALNRTNVTAFSVGETGPCGQLISPWLGAPMVYGRIGGRVDESLPIERVLQDYSFPKLPAVRQLFGVVGRTADESPSPRSHNAAYQAISYPALYVPIATTDFLTTWRTLTAGLDSLGLPFGGATIMAPYKEAAVRLADLTSGAAARAGAANVLVRTENGWRAHTTDPISVVGALGRAGVQLNGREAAVVGCGGAGRGAAAGLLRFGVKPTLVNRGPDRGVRAARLLGLNYLPLHRFVPSDYSLIVHATPVSDEMLFPIDQLAGETILVDLVCTQGPTALVRAARRRRLRVIDGWEVSKIATARQFRLMTGQSMPNKSPGPSTGS